MGPRIAIIGGGPSGLSILQGVMDVPAEFRTWSVDLFEAREDIGGTWLPDDNTSTSEPATAIYPTLHTNDPLPLATIPGFPFPPSTPLHPSHAQILAYRKHLVTANNLTPHIHTSHRVSCVTRSSTSWVLAISHPRGRETRSYDHLVVATGKFQSAKFPTVFGEKEWLAVEGREKGHAKWYRGPEGMKGRTVVLVGHGPSASSILSEVAPVAMEVIVCGKPVFPVVSDKLHRNTRFLPKLAGFTSSSLLLTDGSSFPTPPNTTLIYCTGYHLSYPFLPFLTPFPPSSWSTTHLPSQLNFNGAHLRPLANSFFAISPDYPLNALMFAGTQALWTGPVSYINGLLLAHSLVDPGVLPSREEAGARLGRHEREVEAAGKDVFGGGHFTSSHQNTFLWPDKIIRRLRRSSRVPLPSTLPPGPYLTSAKYTALTSIAAGYDAWEQALLSGGQEFAESFTRGVGTEEGFEEAMGRLREWWAGRVRERGVRVGRDYWVSDEVVEEEGGGGVVGEKQGAAW